MSPVRFNPEDMSFAKRETRGPGKITDPDGLVLEAWAQGFMVGSLIIMACITIANMRRGVLLHKLILIEVSKPSSAPAQGPRLAACLQQATQTLLTIPSAVVWHLAGLLPLLQPAALLLVAFCRGHLPQRLLVASQRHRLDEEQAVLLAQSKLHLHWHRHSGAAVLGGGNLCQFHLLS